MKLPWTIEAEVIGESVASQLPSRANGGPADAYRHMLLSAELTRNYGQEAAFTILESHEFENTGGADNGLDFWNNEIGIAIGVFVDAVSGDWDDVITLVRQVVAGSFPTGSYSEIANWNVLSADDGIALAYPRSVFSDSFFPPFTDFDGYADNFSRNYDFRQSGTQVTLNLNGGQLVVPTIATVSPSNWATNPEDDLGNAIPIANLPFPDSNWVAGVGFVYEEGNGNTPDNWTDEEINQCFPSGTLIRLWDGSAKPIEAITQADVVLTHDTQGNRVPGVVDKLFTNTTSEFIRLSLSDGRDPIVTTPGHRFLTETGDYMEIGHMLRLGGGTARVVDLDGSVIEATGELIVYSAETAHMFPEAQTKTIAMQGNTVLKEQVEAGWQTYNFEVREHHNYVAGGVRVHNDSILSTLESGDQLLSLNGGLSDAAIIRDGEVLILDGYPDAAGNTQVGLYYAVQDINPFDGKTAIEFVSEQIANNSALSSDPMALLSSLLGSGAVLPVPQGVFSPAGFVAGLTLADIFSGNSSNNTLNGNANANLLNGDAGNDTLNGNAGDDTLVGGADNDTINGGSGFDTALVDGDRTAFSVARDGNNAAGNNFKFTATSNDGMDSLRDVERIQYDDGRIALDVHGGWDSDNGRAGYVYRLYEAVLDRHPDINGLTSWVDLYDANDAWTRITMANQFLNSQEFSNKYSAFLNGAADTNTKYVTYFYNSALDRAPDAAGLNNWLTQMNNGMSRADVASRFAASGEMRNLVFNDVKDGIWLDSFPTGVTTFRLAATSDASIPFSGYTTDAPDIGSWFDVSTASIIAQYSDNYQRISEGTEGADRLNGNRKSDLIVGGDGNDTMTGGNGADLLIGGDGNDVLWGQNGHDILNGGAGDNVLHGGNGRDTFIFEFNFEERNDVIEDFKSGNDVIQIDWITFDDLTIVDSKSGAVITYNDTETITLRGVAADTISEGDFILAQETILAESDDPFFIL